MNRIKRVYPFFLRLSKISVNGNLYELKIVLKKKKGGEKKEGMELFI